MKIDEKDLAHIHSLAVNNMIQLPIRSTYHNTTNAQTYAFTLAVIQFFNSKQLLKEEIELGQSIMPGYEVDKI